MEEDLVYKRQKAQITLHSRSLRVANQPNLLLNPTLTRLGDISAPYTNRKTKLVKLPSATTDRAKQEADRKVCDTFIEYLHQPAKRCT